MSPAASIPGESDPPHPIVWLPDGMPVLLRLITPADREAVKEAFRRLSPDSRYYRFWTAQEALPDSILNSFLNAEPGLHETWAAQDPQHPDEPGYGGGSFWRSRSDPESAEISFTVADECQRKGLGNLLLAVLWVRAKACGISKFCGHVLGDNYSVLDWFRALGAVMTFSSGHYQFVLSLDETQLRATRTSEKLLKCLRIVEAALADPGITQSFSSPGRPADS